ncbi:MAG: hypothetical protein IPL79_07455 [Myxococcales bacterium]|nr:hypothetical protein [Myxococcales bacterium]
MPYDVDGWIEVTYLDSQKEAITEEHAWLTVISLSAFSLSGGGFSERLFGLAKHSAGGLFARRGVPVNATPLTISDFNEGDGIEGARLDPTHAYWNEVEEAILTSTPSVFDDPDEREWATFILAVRGVINLLGKSPDKCRLIIWGNW